ncbi:MAG: hypothetical protein AB1597_04970 [Chloroflexota bacterium]
MDENLSYIYAKAFASLGFNMISVQEAFGRKGVPDEEFIPWLGEKGHEKAVWITQDFEAREDKNKVKLILASNISILWIRSERKKISLTGLQELQLLALVIAPVTQLISDTKQPLYMWASLKGMKPKLFKLISSLASKKIEMKPINLTQLP